MNVNMNTLLCTIFLLLCSCRQDLTKPNQELIIGEWYPLGSYDTFSNDFNLTGYEFREGGICENKLGYYEYADTNLFRFSNPYKKPTNQLSVFENRWLNNILYSYGTTTSYSVKHDTLKRLFG